jgi:hypothetical protein
LKGVSLRRVGKNLKLEIMVKKINLKEGKLDNNKKKSVWIGNENKDE